ncbi:MAG: hypothetical protein ACFFCZ_22615 [Promethearchaeota archaeon]
MTKETDRNEKTVNHQDFINFKPEIVKLLSKEAMDLLTEHIPLFGTLQEKKSMTVKEIHELYPEIRAKKTIYRYLEKLEEAGLVAVAGYRMTEGSRIPEKLYCRAARVFFTKLDEEERKAWGRESGEIYGKKLAISLSEVFQVPEPDTTAFTEVIKRFFELQRQAIVSLMENIRESNRLAELYAITEIDQIKYLSDISATFTIFLQHPELLAQLKDLLGLKK